MAKQTVCLNMIVKDEEHVIRRSLTALRNLFDYWVIVDTGSSDGTIRVIKEFLEGTPGELHERPWINFGHNRSEALALARGKGDYVLFFDADDIPHLPEGFGLPALTADAYHAVFKQSSTQYERIILVRNALPWRYEGVIHAYATPDRQYSSATLTDFRIESRRDGARGAMDPRTKYLKNAAILRLDLSRNPKNSRSAFYLAMSYRDAGETEKAIAAYAKRISMGGWEEEIWYAKFDSARLMEKSGAAFGSIVGAFIEAHRYRPIRAEALGHLASYCRRHGKHWSLARAFAAEGMRIPTPEDLLFIETSWYTWRCKDEYAVASYWLKDFESARTANLELLQCEDLPDEMRPRIIENLDYCASALEKNRNA